MADPERDNPQEQEVGRPDWLPANFDSPEALAQSYKELQGAFTRVSQEKSAIEENFAGIASRLDELSAVQQPQQQYVDPTQQAQLLAEQLGVDPEVLNAAAFVAQATAQQILQQQTQQLGAQNDVALNALRENNQERAAEYLRTKYPDWDSKVDRIRDTLEQNPYLVSDDDMLSAQTLVNRFEGVYKQLTYDDLVNGTSTEGAPQTNMAELAQRMKLNAQTAPGASGRPDPVTDEKAAWDAIRNAKPNTYYT